MTLYQLGQNGSCVSKVFYINIDEHLGINRTNFSTTFKPGTCWSLALAALISAIRISPVTIQFFGPVAVTGGAFTLLVKDKSSEFELECPIIFYLPSHRITIPTLQLHWHFTVNVARQHALDTCIDRLSLPRAFIPTEGIRIFCHDITPTFSNNSYRPGKSLTNRPCGCCVSFINTGGL